MDYTGEQQEIRQGLHGSVKNTSPILKRKKTSGLHRTAKTSQTIHRRTKGNRTRITQGQKKQKPHTKQRTEPNRMVGIHENA